MPFGIHKHSNRSRGALNDQAQGSQSRRASASHPAADPSASPVFAPSTEHQQHQQHQQHQHRQHAHSGSQTPPALQQPSHPEPQPYRGQSPAQPPPETDTNQSPSTDPTARPLAQSARYSAYQIQQQQQQQQILQAQPGGSTEDLDNDLRHAQQHPRPNPAAAPASNTEQRKSRGIFDRMRSNRLSHVEPKSPSQGPGQFNSTSVFARRLSKRQETSPIQHAYSNQQRSSFEQQRPDWPTAQDSRSHLPSPQEGPDDDSGIDPYQIRGPELEDARNQSFAQAQNQQPTIRPVPTDSEPPPFHHQNGGDHQQYPSPQSQYSQAPNYHQPSESSSQSNYDAYSQGSHSQQQLNIQPGLTSQDSYRQTNSETVSQLSYDSPIDQREEQRPSSVQSNGPSPTAYQRQQYPDRTTSIQGSRPASQILTAMAPPPTGAQQQNRRSADPRQGTQGQTDQRDAPPPNYSRGPSFAGNQQPTPALSPMPSSSSAQGSSYRGGPPQKDQFAGGATGEQGRSTPPPQPAGQDVAELYKELQIKYKKVKGLYFDKTAQVENLQNTLANQRLSHSRTSLDDSEYMTRFQRLDGATTNLAFNIRKDWKVIPGWLAPYTNQDALKIGKQEMTAVGRACITKFLVDQIFDSIFHPGLDIGLSMALKNIEQNIRRYSPQITNQEESDALTAKVIHWRLATLEGLRDVLHTSESEENKLRFLEITTGNLAASLIQYLQEPIPAGIAESAHMIVELAVSIASNLPLESRDIQITYPMPGDMLSPLIMKTEAGIPPLENPGADLSSEAEAASTGSGDKDDSRDSEKSEGGGKLRKDKPKNSGGMLQAMMGGGSTSSSGKKGSISSQGGQGEEPKGKVSNEDGAQKVRFAGFVGVEVRGRQNLSKAPVWTIS